MVARDYTVIGNPETQKLFNDVKPPYPTALQIRFTAITAALLMSSVLESEEVIYRFTGTVQGAPPQIDFNSPERPASGIEARLGDRVSGTFVIDARHPNAVGLSTNILEFDRDVSNIQISIEDRPLFSDEGPGGVVNLANDVTELEFHSLNSAPVDFLTITTFWGGEFINRQEKIGIRLHLVDSTGQRFPEQITDDTEIPEPIDISRYDIATGFIHGYDNSRRTTNIGILFQIDSLEIFDPNGSEPTPPIELMIGHHVAWPESAEGYTLEESDSPDGPWTRSSRMPIVNEGLKIIVMDKQSPKKFFRLIKPD